MREKPTFHSHVSMLPTFDVVRIFKWYRSNLGFSGDIWPVDPPGYATLRRDDACLKFTHVPTLEKLGWLSKGATEDLQKKWHGVTVSLPVCGVAELRDELASRGVAYTTIQDCDARMVGLSMRDPDGNTLEIREAT